MTPKTKYRIVTDNYAGYEVQVKRWWFPFWVQCTMGGSNCNTHVSIEAAKRYIKSHKEQGKTKKAVYSE